MIFYAHASEIRFLKSSLLSHIRLYLNGRGPWLSILPKMIATGLWSDVMVWIILDPSELKLGAIFSWTNI